MNQHDQIHCSLVMGKSRVVPLKAVSVPRLELVAALLSVRISKILSKELSYPVTHHFWTDSKVVLSYIQNESTRFKTFVANRVQEIRDNSSPNDWSYVPSHLNPADDASRGLHINDLLGNSRWLEGPRFMWQEVIPVFSSESIGILPEDPEVKTRVLNTLTLSNSAILERLERFSSWKSAMRAVAVCLRFKEILHLRATAKGLLYTQRNPYICCSVQEIQVAATEIIKILQNETFQEEITTIHSIQKQKGLPCGAEGRDHARSLKKRSSLYQLNPFIDKQGLLRVGGRLIKGIMEEELKHPIILPKNHHITTLIIRDCHERVAHQGRGMTLNAIRTHGYWIISGTAAVVKFLADCVPCRRAFGATQTQIMADLPEDRVQEAPPFSFCGVDIFGPWIVREGRKDLKRYGALFTCLASRAIHIESTDSLTTDSFINALRRFIAIRGPIRQLRCDQGTNFVGAERELKQALSEMNQQYVGEFLRNQHCDYFPFKMNAPKASHAGGIWERQIRSVRRILQILLQEFGAQLSDESLRTLLLEASAIVNSRPLTVDQIADPKSNIPLSPNNLLTMKTQIILPPPGNFDSTDIYHRKQWRRVQHIANEFWHRWKREYLQSLQPRQKWTRSEPDVKVGDLVLVKDIQTPRNQWPLAKIEEVLTGDDSHVRRVKLLMCQNGQKSVLERPIQKIVLIVSHE